MQGTHWILAGLGNPGPAYSGTRHNIGFLALDAVAQAYGFPAWKKSRDALIAEGSIGEHRLVLLKPQTFMNLSGQSVGPMLQACRAKPGQLIVFHDDLDLAFGKLRVKRGGGAGGHNGLRSIDQQIGTDYWRIRMGIGHPGEREDVTGHVLSRFGDDEQAPLSLWLSVVARELPLMLTGQNDTFASRVAIAMQDKAAPKNTEKASSHGL
ncbi:MAG: aminoacyl-tRNA hydrolase [Alphaproteobacteria bacterium]|nr:MAG: aminoacyl-tRNA hydrolase [Alphaproteobacteria bacterium]